MLLKRAGRNGRATRNGMSKILSLVIVGLMIVQIIRPLGLPGLKRRADFWKLAVVALGLIVVTAGLSHGG
jgi:hypothetical protein